MRFTTDRPSTSPEVLIGKTLAMFAHPYAAWRSGTRSTRTVVVAAYFAASYAVVLVALKLS
jgi:hypothetical protein